MDFKDILGDLTSPGDTATVLLAGTLGFVLDAGLNIVGFLEPGYVGFTFASSALGLKRAWEANWGHKRALENRRMEVKEKGQRIRAFMVKVNRADWRKRSIENFFYSMQRLTLLSVRSN